MRHRSYAYGTNHWDLDPDLVTVLRSWWPTVDDEAGAMRAFGSLAGGDAYLVADHVDHHAQPYLLAHDLDGNRVDRAVLAPSHADLLARLRPMNRPPYGGGSWHHHFAMGMLLADPGLYCILIITNQTAYAVHKYAPDLAQWRERLIEGDAWGATWLTEVQGGSDLGANRTTATPDGDGWRLDGEKYFASGAGLADCALVTARPVGAPPGPRGLALFLLPRVSSSGALNFAVRRFKSKSATRAVPSGEVELAGSEAHLIGRPELGIYYTLENLTVARLANAAAAMGMARKAHLEAALRCRAREAFGAPLRDHPLVRRDLTDLAVRTAGGLALTFRAVDAFDRCWHDTPPFSDAYHDARLLAHLAKGRTADHAAACTRLAMELFGGLGFLEEYAVARWHREALITPIWEGSANIQALDMLEALGRGEAAERFAGEVESLLAAAGTAEAGRCRDRLGQVLADLRGAAPRQAQWLAKEALTAAADVAQVAQLYRLAAAAGDRWARIAGLYARRFVLREEYPAWAMDDAEIWDAVPEI